MQCQGTVDSADALVVPRLPLVSQIIAHLATEGYRQPFLFPSIAAVAVEGTLLSGGKGSYWGMMAGAIVLTLITSLLTTMQMPDSVRRMVLGATLLILISIYGRQRALRQ